MGRLTESLKESAKCRILLLPLHIHFCLHLTHTKWTMLTTVIYTVKHCGIMWH